MIVLQTNKANIQLYISWWGAVSHGNLEPFPCSHLESRLFVIVLLFHWRIQPQRIGIQLEVICSEESCYEDYLVMVPIHIGA